MTQQGMAQCIVCPIVAKKAKKKAQQLCEAIQTAWSPKSSCSNLPEFEVVEAVSLKDRSDTISKLEKLDPVPYQQLHSSPDTKAPTQSQTTPDLVNRFKNCSGQNNDSMNNHNKRCAPAASPIKLPSLFWIIVMCRNDDLLLSIVVVVVGAVFCFRVHKVRLFC